MSSNVEFEEKIEVNSFTLSDKKNMASGQFIIVGAGALPLFIIWFFQNSGNTFCLFSNLNWALCIFQNILAAITSSSECNRQTIWLLYLIGGARCGRFVLNRVGSNDDSPAKVSAGWNAERQIFPLMSFLDY